MYREDFDLGTDLIYDVFNEAAIEAIEEIINSSINDNSVRQNKIKDIMRALGFRMFRTGTNRITGYHPSNETVVYKVAIDAMGIKDNMEDVPLSQDMHLAQDITAIYECLDGIVLVAERVKQFESKAEMEPYRDAILRIIMRVQEKYLPDDIGEEQFMNYGLSLLYNRPVILDFAYLVLLENLDLTCDGRGDSKCGEELVYNSKISELVCPKCGKAFTFYEIKNRRNKQDSNDNMSDISKGLCLAYDEQPIQSNSKFGFKSLINKK
ncbi:MAG: hypothetical protein ACRCXT_07170 [Paraclostridium sp.]